MSRSPDHVLLGIISNKLEIFLQKITCHQEWSCGYKNKVVYCLKTLHCVIFVKSVIRVAYEHSLTSQQCCTGLLRCRRPHHGRWPVSLFVLHSSVLQNNYNLFHLQKEAGNLGAPPGEMQRCPWNMCPMRKHFAPECGHMYGDQLGRRMKTVVFSTRRIKERLSLAQSYTVTQATRVQQ